MNREALTASFPRWTVGSSLSCPIPRRNGTRKKRIWMSQTKPKWFVASEKIQWIILLHYTQCSAFFFFLESLDLSLCYFLNQTVQFFHFKTEVWPKVLRALWKSSAISYPQIFCPRIILGMSSVLQFIHNMTLPKGSSSWPLCPSQ